ncbi:MAG: hypothetical protein PVH73_04085 [Candidatus Bathyarchaeota archaeon]
MDEWIRRLHALPTELRKLIREDMKTALQNRIKVMERINNKTRKN